MGIFKKIKGLLGVPNYSSGTVKVLVLDTTTNELYLKDESSGALEFDPGATNALRVANSGGNTRGDYAVDLQEDRNVFDNSLVASGDYAFNAGGYNNKASGNYSFCQGNKNLSSAESGVSFGQIAEAYLFGQFAHANKFDENSRNAQFSRVLLHATTMSQTEVEMTTPGSPYRLIMKEDSVWSFKINLVARDRNNFDTYSEIGTGAIKNDSGTVTLLRAWGSTSVYEQDWGFGGSFDVTADATYDSLKLAVTGENGKTIDWHAVVELNELINV